MKIEKIEVYGFQHALRNMRNPRESWDKGDSVCNIPVTLPYGHFNGELIWAYDARMGPRDLDLACKLIKAGSEHRKFIRCIQILIDITIPRYLWQGLDTYKIATVRNSCSTMHKLGTRELVESDFEGDIVLEPTLKELNGAGHAYRNKTLFTTSTGSVIQGYDIVRYMKKILPEGYLQRAGFKMNYETALNMYCQRYDHRLPEWNASVPTSICAMILALPYMSKFINALRA